MPNRGLFGRPNIRSTTQPHDHSGVANDGGVLTNDLHDGYAEFATMADPSTPPAGSMRVYLQTGSGKPTWKDDAGNVHTFASPGLNANVTFNNSFASPPASPSAGDLWLPSDSNGLLYRYNGTLWLPYGNAYPLSTPPTSGWSWVNQGSATVDSTYGQGIALVVPGAGDTVTMTARVRTKPAGAYTVTAHMIGDRGNKDYHAWGLLWRESTGGTMVLHGYQVSGIQLQLNQKWSSATAVSATYSNYNTYGPPFEWLRIQDDGATNRLLFGSCDGQHWQQLHSVGRTDYQTPDQIGFFVSPRNAITPNWDSVLVVDSWTEA